MEGGQGIKRVMEGSLLEGEKREKKREQESEGQQKHEEKLGQGRIRIDFAFETQQKSTTAGTCFPANSLQARRCGLDGF